MSVRIYVPGDWEGIGEAVAVGRMMAEAGGEASQFRFAGHVVTDELRAALHDLDDEELEHYVVTEAAQESLRNFRDEGEPMRRLVLVFEVDAVERVPETLTGAAMSAPVRVPQDVVAWLVDTEDAAEDVDAAVSALWTDDEAGTQEQWQERTRRAVEACLERELAWYAPSEADEVLGLR